MVHPELTQFDENRRVNLALSLKSYHPQMTRLDKLVNGDEKWGMYLNIAHRATWVDAEATAPDISKSDVHGLNVMLSVWWSVRGMEYWELLAQGTTITAIVYSCQLHDLMALIDSSRGKQAFIHLQHYNA